MVSLSLDAEVLEEVIEGVVTRDMMSAAASSVHFVMPNLMIGSESNCAKAQANGCTTVSVRHIACPNPSCKHIPVLDMAAKVAHKRDLDDFADWLDDNWRRNGKKVYVHCYHGIERAPLAVAYAIKRAVLPGVAFDRIYSWVRLQRVVALDRSSWLKPELLKELLS